MKTLPILVTLGLTSALLSCGEDPAGLLAVSPPMQTDGGTSTDGAVDQTPDGSTTIQVMINGSVVDVTFNAQGRPSISPHDGGFGINDSGQPPTIDLGNSNDSGTSGNGNGTPDGGVVVDNSPDSGINTGGGGDQPDNGVVSNGGGNQDQPDSSVLLADSGDNNGGGTQETPDSGVTGGGSQDSGSSTGDQDGGVAVDSGSNQDSGTVGGGDSGNGSDADTSDSGEDDDGCDGHGHHPSKDPHDPWGVNSNDNPNSHYHHKHCD